MSHCNERKTCPRWVGKWQRGLGLQVQALRRLHPSKAQPPVTGRAGQGWAWCLPEGGAFGPRDFQEVITVLKLEVNEDQSDGVSQLSQDGPCAIGIVVVLRGEVGAGDDAALAPQGPATGIIRCGQEERGSHELVLFAGLVLTVHFMVRSRQN